MNYYYLQESGEPAGPIPESALRALLNSGVIKRSTPIMEAGGKDWQPFATVFPLTSAPAAPIYQKRMEPMPPKRTAWLPKERPDRDSYPVKWGSVAVALCVVTASAFALIKRPGGLPYVPGAWLKGGPPLAEKVVAKVLDPTPKAQAAPAPQKVEAATAAPPPAKPPEKADPDAEWYEFGFLQGKEMQVVYTALAQKLTPDKHQLTMLLFNMGLYSDSLLQENFNVCFEGYKDGCGGLPQARTVSATQNKSVLPAKLRGYRHFTGDGNNFANASRDPIQHALAATVMILGWNGEEYKGQGSGFFIAPGLIVTNRHVVFECDRFEIRMPDRSVVEGKSLGYADHIDVGVIKVETTDHEILRLGNVASVKVGDSVTAVGFPKSLLIAKWSGTQDRNAVLRDLEATATFGFVSALNRKFTGMDCFQLDLTINHGNSGGPLIDSAGRVIGIATFGLQFEGMDRTNFAIKWSAAMAFVQAHCTTKLDLDE